jgi:hypothetical protein
LAFEGLVEEGNNIALFKSRGEQSIEAILPFVLGNDEERYLFSGEFEAKLGKRHFAGTLIAEVEEISGVFGPIGVL